MSLRLAGILYVDISFRHAVLYCYFDPSKHKPSKMYKACSSNLHNCKFFLELKGEISKQMYVELYLNLHIHTELEHVNFKIKQLQSDDVGPYSAQRELK